MQNLKIIHSPTDESPFLVIAKPAGLPSAPLFEGDSSALTEAAKDFPQILQIRGKKEVEHGLVHRIDTETNGLVLIATTQKSYDSLILSQKEGKFEKWYRAEIDPLPESPELLGGFPPLENEWTSMAGKKNSIIESSFRPFGKKGCEVRPVTQNSGRSALKKGGSALYTTEITLDSHISKSGKEIAKENKAVEKRIKKAVKEEAKKEKKLEKAEAKAAKAAAKAEKKQKK